MKLLFLFSLWLACTSQAETVRVRLHKVGSRIALEGLGLNVGLRPQSILPAGLPKMNRIEVHLERDVRGLPVWQLSRGNKAPQRLMGKTIFIEGQTLRVGLKPVPNTIELAAGAGGHVDVIAALDLEKYLTGVLPSEMPASWPLEALKAQAVASRSYALFLMKERRDQTFQLESTVLDQVFDLQKHTAATETVREKVARAVRETQGQVLLGPRNEIVKAHYHADCGGSTETARNVWGERVLETGTTRDALCPLSPLARWQHRLSKLELKQALAPYFGIGPEVALESVALVGRTASGRVAAVDVIFSDRQSRRMTSHEFRRAVGFHHLKSTNFALYWRGEALVIEGKGHGHGVGLCQYGARQLARRGLNYREIVATYYPNVRIGQMSPKGPML